LLIVFVVYSCSTCCLLAI